MTDTHELVQNWIFSKNKNAFFEMNKNAVEPERTKEDINFQVLPRNLNGL